MTTTSFIKRYIFRLPLGKIFTTRDVLIYGTRAAIDQALAKLVKQEVIVRLARGVFVRQGSNLENISVTEVARVKAESFGRHIAVWGGELVVKLGLTTKYNHEHVYCVNSSSSKFKFGTVTVYFRKTCPRKMHFSGTAPGQWLHALWHLGKHELDNLKSIPFSFSWLKRTERQEIRTSFNWLPAWLAAQFLHWRLPPANLQS